MSTYRTTRSRVALALTAAAALLGGLAAPATAHDWRDEHHGHVPDYDVSPISADADEVQLAEIGRANPGRGANADVFAHEGHAYLGSWIGQKCLSKGVRVYDLANPAKPRRVSTFADAASEPDLAGTWTEKVIVRSVRTPSFTGDLAAVSVQACDSAERGLFRGFALYDVTDPARPRPLGRHDTGRPTGSSSGTGGAHELDLAFAGGKAYVYAAVPYSEFRTAEGAPGPHMEPGKPDLRIVDVTDPRRPRAVGGWGAWAALGISPFPDGDHLDFSKISFAHSVRVAPDLRTAYVSYWGTGTVILDVRDPARPEVLGRTRPPEGAAHSSALMRGGRVLVETHERRGGVASFWDISDPAHPKPLGRFVARRYRNDSVHDPKISDGIAYFSWYRHGVLAADVSSVWEPTRLAQWQPATSYVNPDYYCHEACTDVWGVFPTDDGLVLASDMNSGLYVLRLRKR